MPGTVGLLCEGIRAVGAPRSVGAAGDSRALRRVLATELREPAVVLRLILAARDGLGRSHPDGSSVVDLRAAALLGILGSRLGGVVAHGLYCSEETRKIRTGAFGAAASERVDTTQNDDGGVVVAPWPARSVAAPDHVAAGSEGSTGR